MTETTKKKKVRPPYENFAAAQADEFKKFGGPDGAFKYMIKGYKGAAWRKRHEQNARAEAAAEEKAFKEQTDKKS